MLFTRSEFTNLILIRSFFVGFCIYLDQDSEKRLTLGACNSTEDRKVIIKYN